MINKATHTETFVVNDTVAEVHTVDAFVDHLYRVGGHQDSVVCGGIHHSMVFGVLILRIVNSIGVHVRALEEVDTNRRRLATVGFGFTATVDGLTVVTVAETTTDIATYIVVPAIAEVNVGPR